MNYKDRYDLLAEHLSDHLWMINSLDLELLKSFPEFIFNGIAYRVLFLSEDIEPDSFIGQSFTKTPEGLNTFIQNANALDPNFITNKIKIIYECDIEGFDVSYALRISKEHGLLSEKSLSFINEEEVIAFSYSPLTKVK